MMLMNETTIILMLVLSGIVVGVINTLAGGGAIIIMTLFMVLGLPINVANGTNRIAVVLQNLTATLAFLRKRLLDVKSGINFRFRPLSATSPARWWPRTSAIRYSRYAWPWCLRLCSCT